MESNMSSNSFVVLGLASCFIREENKLLPVEVIEPIPSATLLTLLEGIPTSYSLLIPSSLEEAQTAFEKGHLSAFPGSARFGENFIERLNAAIRTYQTNPQAAERLDAPLNLNNPAPQNRILNLSRSISDADNVKQHPSSFTA